VTRDGAGLREGVRVGTFDAIARDRPLPELAHQLGAEFVPSEYESQVPALEEKHNFETGT
jgi:hypothetical protein